MEPLVSVIIPTYNRSRFVIQAIDSVLQQSFRDYEIIVIDDGSTDDTRKVLEVYANKIKYIYQINSGVSAARNAGINVARGEWIAFLDSDDEWTKDYLTTQMENIRKYPTAIAHITNAVTVLPSGERSSLFVETELLDKFRDMQLLTFDKPLSVIINHSPWFLQSTVMRKDILLKAGLFDIHLSIAEDLDVIARVSRRGSFTFCRRELVEVFRRDEETENLGAQSRRRLIVHNASFAKVYQNLLNFEDVTMLERICLSRKLSVYLRAHGNALVMAGMRYEARHYYMKSVTCYPSIRSLIRLCSTFLPKSRSFALL